MTIYNWQQKDWPNFRYNISEFEYLLFDYKEKTGKIAGLLQGLDLNDQIDVQIDLILTEAITTSSIEGEYLSRKDVASSIRRQLGIQHSSTPIKDKKAQGISLLLLNLKNYFSEPLTEETLFTWHSLLLPKELCPRSMQIGKWRTHVEPMQIVSGFQGKIKIHFEAPPSKIVPKEMKRFLTWFNQTAPGKKNQIRLPIVRAAIAHLYFETIHPFEDGNGRIGRAIAEKVLSQELHRPIFLSLSNAMEKNKKEYYQALKKAQRSNEITEWIVYFIKTVLQAQILTENKVNFILRKTKFLDHFKNQFNTRQQKVILRMLSDEYFEGGMNASKYISLTKTSKATATRDLIELFQLGALNQIKAGRSTRYEINWDIE